jgi:SET domain-containing protein
MYLYKLERRPSPISGSGVFALEDIPQGSMVIAAPTIMGKTVTAEATAKKIFELSDNAGADPFLRVFHRSCIRLVGPHFSFSDELIDTDYLNHSFEPNLLFAMGHCLAVRDIASGEELMIDYRLVLPSGDSIGIDEATGRPIVGLSGIEVIRHVARELEVLYGR